MIFKRVLCPFDFSRYSRRALRHARALAAPHGAELHVLHVIGAFAPPEVPLTEQPPLIGTTDYGPPTRAAIARLIDELGPASNVYPVVRQGQTVPTILEYAADMRADLMVVGTYGRSRLDQLLLGFTAERLVHGAGCAVLTIPEGGDEPGSFDQLRFTSVLCAVDFSPAANRAVEYAVLIVRANDAGLTLLHAAHVVRVEEECGRTRVDIGTGEGLEERDALTRLKALLPGDLQSSSRLSLVVEGGPASRMILREADRRGVDLIVMGARGSGGAELVLFGSTTHEVVRGARCPVLTVPAVRNEAVMQSAQSVERPAHVIERR